MGIEPSEKSVKQEKFEEFDKQLRIMLNMFDQTEVLTLIRKVYEEVKQWINYYGLLLYMKLLKYEVFQLDKYKDFAKLVKLNVEK